ncbi:MAG: stage III sporulation protein AE [Christensenellaceae bacterium]|jgi:stage III sporulation protein AE|nr:stage III sporulation protein AE [Christensenellaceae bacterium]
MKKKNLKRLFLVLIILILSPLVFSGGQAIAYADDENSAEEELQQNVDKQLDGFDFGGLDQILSQFGNSEQGIFGGGSFLDKVRKLISGEFGANFGDFFSYLFALLFDDLLGVVPVLATIVAIAIVCSFISQINSQKSKSISNVIYFVCFGAIVVLTFSVCQELIGITQQTLFSIKAQMEIVFPILLTLIASIGGVVTVSAFQPAIAFLLVAIMEIFTVVIIPLFIFTLAFNVVGNLSSSIKLEKFAGFCNSLFKWIIGIVFTIFIAFITIQGITASAVDGVSIKTAKFAIKSYIPVLGGYLSDGLNLIMASSILIKNAVGATGLILLIASVISPLVKILVFMLGLKLVAAITEPLCDGRISNFLSGVSKCLVMLIVCIIGVSFMYLVTAGLLMCLANVV